MDATTHTGSPTGPPTSVPTSSDQTRVCPACAARPGAFGLTNKIGNRRAHCRTCNAFVQRVLRLTRRRLAAMHPLDHAATKEQAERDVYAALRTRPTDGQDQT